MTSHNAVTRGRFICLEGIEGVGKSTHLNTVIAHLQARGITAVSTREPGGTVLGEAIRTLLLSQDFPPMHGDTELLLMFAARAEHLQRVILPHLAAGTWVVSDRFTDATYAYQGGGRGIAQTRITQLENWVQGTLRPDLTIVLDTQVSTGLSRAGKRGDSDRFEQETLEFFQRVSAAYQQRVAQDPARYLVVDASGTLDQVRHDLLTTLDAHPVLQEYTGSCPP
ncbi:dTMP kinase [Ectothiorhodospira magna]|uniref:dTMP kinase n=1 Tax=Ectothiorhodospira magna TaxID=867345 RepID=UPI000B7F4001|nr:dTMP kinase [Ectothiorhodospira magna]